MLYHDFESSGDEESYFIVLGGLNYDFNEFLRFYFEQKHVQIRKMKNL